MHRDVSTHHGRGGLLHNECCSSKTEQRLHARRPAEQANCSTHIGGHASEPRAVLCRPRKRQRRRNWGKTSDELLKKERPKRPVHACGALNKSRCWRTRRSTQAHTLLMNFKRSHPCGKVHDLLNRISHSLDGAPLVPRVDLTEMHPYQQQRVCTSMTLAALSKTAKTATP